MGNIYPDKYTGCTPSLKADAVYNDGDKRLYIEVISHNEEWRLLLGKAMAYSYDAKMGNFANCEIWFVTDFDFSKDEGLVEWWKLLKDIMCEYLGNKIFFMKAKKHKKKILKLVPIDD